MPAMTSFLSLLEPLEETPRLLEIEPEFYGDREPELPEPAEDLAAKAQQAVAQAREILAQAKAEASETLADARLQAEAYREAAWQEGFHDGKQAAHQQIEAELREQWDLECADFRAEAQSLIEGIIQARQELWDSQESEMVAFALDIARQVIKTEISQNNEIVTHILHNALRRVTDKENIRIRVSIGDAPRIRDMRDDLMTLIDGIKNLEILDDRRIGDGGCIIETGAGTIDAKIETQIDEVERAISHASA